MVILKAYNLVFAFYDSPLCIFEICDIPNTFLVTLTRFLSFALNVRLLETRYTQGYSFTLNLTVFL
jgi:hypothetical protein